MTSKDTFFIALLVALVGASFIHGCLPSDPPVTETG